MPNTTPSPAAPLPTMAAILSLLADCDKAVETAAHALYRHGRAAEIDALTALSCLACEIMGALEARAAAAPEHFAEALARSRVLSSYVAPFLTRRVDAYKAGELLEALELAARRALETDEQEESEVVVPWGGCAVRARVYWMQGGPRVSIEGGRGAGCKLGIEEAEAMVGGQRSRFDALAVAAAGSPVGF